MTEPTVEPTNWTAIWTGLLGAIGSVGMWFAGRRKNGAAEAADVATLGARQAEAQADGEIYRRLLARVVALESDVLRLNHELDAERRLRRLVENHVAVLERLMRAAGLSPPTFDPFTSMTPAPPEQK